MHALSEYCMRSDTQTGEEIKHTSVEAKDISLSVMFSDDDALSGEGNQIMDLQLSQQIRRVESFLKMDRLRRTKLSKL